MPEKIRLLACSDCKTVEELDDYTGPRERADEYDVILNIALEKHRDGVEQRPHIGQLFDVPKQDWDNPNAREQILQQVSAKMNGGETGLGSEAYALRDTFREDAFTCWQQHNRNPACSDYKSPSKRLVPQTSAERREIGAAPASQYDATNPALTRFLCEYCPVHSMVVTARRKKAGMYDK